MMTKISTKFIMLFNHIIRVIGSIYYWLKSGWRPLVLWFVAVALLICFPDYITLVFNTKAGTQPQWLNILVLPWWNAWLQQWKTVLAVYTLLLLLWWVWRARKRVVIESFIDYRGDKPSPDPQGLATLLMVRLAQLRELYQIVDEKRSISMDAGPNQAIDATIKAEDVSGFLQGAVSAQSQLNLGPFLIPVGTLLALIGRFLQGPRIIGSLHKDRDILILTAQRVGGQLPLSWRVEGRERKQSADGESYNLSVMIEELAYRIFTDLALNRSVQWKATSAFCEGLRAYHECLHTPKDSKLKLQRAEKKFIETLVEDQEFVLAYYNLGVVYTELSRLEAFEKAFRIHVNGEQVERKGKQPYSEAAEQAFITAIALNPRSWRAFYALGVNRCDQGEFESAIRLYKRALEFDPEIAIIAQIYYAIGIAQYFFSQENSKNNFEHLAEKYLNQALESYKKAVALSWKALLKAELTKQNVSEAETIVSVCLTTLATVYNTRGKEFYKHCDWKKAEKSFMSAGDLFRQAMRRTPYNSEAHLKLVDLYTENHFDLGKTVYYLENYSKARDEFEAAARLNLEKPKYRSGLALAYAQIYRKSKDREAAESARSNSTKVLEALKGVFDAGQKSAKILNRDANDQHWDDIFSEVLKPIKEASNLLGDTELSQVVVEIENFLSSLAQDWLQEERAINVLENKLLICKEQKWKYAQISLALGYMYLHIKNARKEQEHFREAINLLKEKYPQEIRNQELRALLIYSLLEQQKYEDAIREAELAFLHEPFCFFERNALGDTYFAMNEFEPAINAWQDALFRKDAFLRKSSFSPRLPELLKSKIFDINFKIGLSNLELARQHVEPSQRKATFQQAAIYLQQFLDQCDEPALQSKSYYLLGILHLELGEYEEAISDFRMAEHLRFAPLHSLFYLGFAYLKNAEYDNSLMRFETLLNEAQKLERKFNSIRTMVEAKVKIASVDPLSLGEIIMLAYWGQAFTYAERDTNLPEALKLIRQAQEYMEKIEKEGGVVQLYYMARCSDCEGWILYKQGQIDDAIKCFECALSKTADAEIYLHLALAYERKLKTCKDDVQLIAQLEACCLHAQKLDFKNECEPVVRDILQRIHKEQ